MKALTLPKMSTVKPRFKYHKSFEESFDKRNFVNQNFNPSKPNNLWFSDISYISLKNRFVYLCVIMDAFSRKNYILENIYKYALISYFRYTKTSCRNS